MCKIFTRRRAEEGACNIRTILTILFDVALTGPIEDPVQAINNDMPSLKGSVFEALICTIILVLSTVMSLRCRVDL